VHILWYNLESAKSSLSLIVQVLAASLAELFKMAKWGLVKDAMGGSASPATVSKEDREPNQNCASLFLAEGSTSGA